MSLLPILVQREIERLILAYSPRFQSILQAARQQILQGEGLQHEDFWREVEGETQEYRRNCL